MSQIKNEVENFLLHERKNMGSIETIPEATRQAVILGGKLFQCKGIDSVVNANSPDTMEILGIRLNDSCVALIMAANSGATLSFKEKTQLSALREIVQGQGVSFELLSAEVAKREGVAKKTSVPKMREAA